MVLVFVRSTSAREYRGMQSAYICMTQANVLVHRGRNFVPLCPFPPRGRRGGAGSPHAANEGAAPPARGVFKRCRENSPCASPLERGWRLAYACRSRTCDDLQCQNRIKHYLFRISTMPARLTSRESRTRLQTPIGLCWRASHLTD